MNSLKPSRIGLQDMSQTSGCNRYLWRYKEGVSNVCLSCKRPNKDTQHILRCTDKQRTTIPTRCEDNSHLAPRESHPCRSVLCTSFLPPRPWSSPNVRLHCPIPSPTPAWHHPRCYWLQQPPYWPTSINSGRADVPVPSTQQPAPSYS